MSSFLASLACFWFYTTFVIANDKIDNSSIVVTTSSGPIRGFLEYTLFEQRPYYAFKGIPYAEPPTGVRRFLPPMPIRPWKTPRDCLEHGPNCLQLNRNQTTVLGDEDCLHLNVYTPFELRGSVSEDLLPVMIFIHGGAWYHGSGDTNLHGPDFLINENVIIVTVNYRLGFMGFLALNSSKYSGNEGLKDQQLAIQWIHCNARAFGGDCGRTTLFGLSSGSISTQIQVRATGSQGLFQRVIEMSFSFDIWSMFRKETQIKEKLREQIGHENITTTELLQFLQTTEATNLVKNFPIVRYKTDVFPRIESEDADHPIMLGTPEDVMYEDYGADIDVMTGFTTAEAITISSWKTFKEFLKNGEIQMPNVHFKREYNTTAYTEAFAKVIQFYFPHGMIEDQDTYERYIQLLSDTHQRYFIDRKVKNLAAKSTGRTYYYRFGLNTPMNYYKNLYNGGHLEGACHGDDLCYVFRCTARDEVYADIAIGSKQHDLIKLMAGMYADFARYGNPLPFGDWQQVQPNKHQLMDITMTGLRMEADPLKEMTKFWTDLMDEYSSLNS